MTELPRPTRVLLTDPAHFEVRYVINAHMVGHVGTVDRARARRQWEGLRATYETLGLGVDVLPSVAGLPDMVFAANQCLPYQLPDGERGVVISQMRTPERAPEVEYYAAYFSALGYVVRRFPKQLGHFEGTGDGLWHPGQFKLYGGYGYRTGSQAYDYLQAELGVEAVRLELVNPNFYHLDTCLSLLDGETALVVPEAFTEAGMRALRANIPTLIEVPAAEARELLACNAHCPDGHHVILQAGAAQTEALLREAGYEPTPVETGEYLKSGGSVFCLKLMYW